MQLQRKIRRSRCTSDLTGAAGFSRKHIAVDVAADVQATVYMVLDTQGSFAVETALTLHDAASLRLVQVLCAQDSALLYAKTDADCAPGAGVDMTQILMGRGDLYSDNDTELVGDGSHYSAQIGYLGRGSQTIDVNVVVNHYGKKHRVRDRHVRRAQGRGEKGFPRHDRL